MSLIYWVGNTKTDAELILPKHDILSLWEEWVRIYGTSGVPNNYPRNYIGHVQVMQLLSFFVICFSKLYPKKKKKSFFVNSIATIHRWLWVVIHWFHHPCSWSILLLTFISASHIFKVLFIVLTKFFVPNNINLYTYIYIYILQFIIYAIYIFFLRNAIIINIMIFH